MRALAAAAAAFVTAFLVLGAVACGARPSRCELPFSSGPCKGYFPVYAYVDGHCVERVYGGCEGNENRFDTWQECVTTCELRQPAANECPPDYTRRSVCTECGAAGGCAKTEEQCARQCTNAECNGLSSAGGTPLTCADGVCQVAGCD